MEQPKKIQTVVLDGHSLTLEALVAVAQYGARVELSDEARKAMASAARSRITDRIFILTSPSFSGTGG